MQWQGRRQSTNIADIRDSKVARTIHNIKTYGNEINNVVYNWPREKLFGPRAPIAPDLLNSAKQRINTLTNPPQRP